MASLTILAVGIVGVIGVMNSSFRVAGSTAARSRGVAVASMWTEKLRAVPYGSLPIPTVDCVSVPNHVECQYRTETEVVNNRKYSVKYAVTKENEQTGPDAGRVSKAYAKAYVQVSWEDESGFHDVHQTTLIYPGGLGVFNAATAVNPTTSGNAPNPPTALTAVTVTNTTGIDLAWGPPVPGANVPEPIAYVVRMSRDPSFSPGQVQEVSANVPAAVTTLRVNDLTPATRYYFQVYAKASNGRLSASAVQFPPSTDPGVLTNDVAVDQCSVGSAAVTPAAIYKKNGAEGSGLRSNPRVEIHTLGGCVGPFRMEYSPRTGRVDDVALFEELPGTFAGTVAGTTQQWEVGEHDITIFSTTGGVKTQRATLRLIVCDHQKRFCP